MSVIKNRLQKNLAKLAPWAKRSHIDAFRVYERDIPDYPFIVDKYLDQFVVFDRGNSAIDSRPDKREHLPELTRALTELTGVDSKNIILKQRQKQKGKSQYQRRAGQAEPLIVREGPARFEVNLKDYLDTGLFLDHRRLRDRVFKMAEAKRFLNLFSYTGAFTVFAALGGARETLSVDLSKTYTEWAERNLKLNGLDLKTNQLISADVLSALEKGLIQGHFDLILLDPPTFSNSKKMNTTFEVQVEQDYLVDRCMHFLTPEGLLIFSNNKRDFRLSPRIQERFQVTNISKESLPKDFRDPKIHHVFEIRHKDLQ